MRNKLIKITRFFGSLLGKRNATAIIVFLHRATDAPIMNIAFNHYGILKGTDMKNSGEEFAIDIFFKPFLNEDDVILDIGANTGDYAMYLVKHICSNRIISIEPNPLTFELLVKNVDHECYNYAISHKEGQLPFYVSHENPVTTLASFSSNTIPENETPKEISVECITLHKLIKNLKIDSLGVLKVDTEGYDYQVLLSGSSFLKDVKFIQFEFNEFHVFTRTFLRDFHKLLSASHDLFRLDTDRLHDLRNYDPKMEIFRFQNILAVRKDLTHLISKHIKA
jgi:FkbM family methyltransferase